MKRRTSHRWHPMIVPARMPTSETTRDETVPKGGGVVRSLLSESREAKKMRLATTEIQKSSDCRARALGKSSPLAVALHALLCFGCWRASLQGSRPALCCHVHGGAAGACHGANRQDLSGSRKEKGAPARPRAGPCLDGLLAPVEAPQGSATPEKSTGESSARPKPPGGNRVLVRTPYLPALPAEEWSLMAVMPVTQPHLLAGTLGPRKAERLGVDATAWRPGGL